MYIPSYLIAWTPIAKGMVSNPAYPNIIHLSFPITHSNLFLSTLNFFVFVCDNK